MNPYINDINSNIIKHKQINDKHHIILKDDIVLDYKKYNIEPEKLYINKEAPIESYDSSMGKVYVINTKPQSNYVNLYLNYDLRIYILKSLTARLLIKSTLNKYLFLEPTNFKTYHKYSTFEINDIYFDQEASEIIKYLEHNINTYITYALDIHNNKEKNETSIDGLLNTKYFDYTVSNLSELNKFSITNYSFNNQGILFTYSII